jgi:hypothetical protein
MTSKTGRVWAACLIAIVVHGTAGTSSAASTADTACAVPSLAGAEMAAATRVHSRQDVAAARSGRIPGLGTVAASVGWDNRSTVVLSERDFTVTRSFTPLTREIELVIAGPGEEPLVVRLGGADGLVVTRNGRTIRGVANVESMPSLLGGRALAAFRERIGNYERRLQASPRARVDDAHAYGFLLAGALISSLAGDPTAVGRTRDIMLRRVSEKLRAVRFDFQDCVTDYERYLLKIDQQRSQCLAAANGRDSWYARAADRLGCEIEFMAQALAGEGQFISCTALGSIVA